LEKTSLPFGHSPVDSMASVARKAWQLLEAPERRDAFGVLTVVILAAAASALMVFSVLPFLTVLADPSQIQASQGLSKLYSFFGFTNDYTFLAWLGASSLIAIVLSNLVLVLRAWAVERFSTMRIHALSRRLLRAYLSQPYEWFLDQHTSELSNRILAESQQAMARFFRPATELVAATLSVLSMLLLLIVIDPLTTFVAAVILGGSYAVIYVATKRYLARIGAERVRTNARRFRIVGEALSGIKDLKHLGVEESYGDLYDVPSRRTAEIIVLVKLLATLPQFFIQTVAFGGIILLCLMLLEPDAMQSDGALGQIVPILGVFAFAGQRLLSEFQKIFQAMSYLRAGAAVIETIHNDLTAFGTTRYDITGPVAPLGLRESLRFENVAYSYPNAEQPGLDAISLEIRAGERIGIVGGTGAGKTTLADIMLGLLSPKSGRIIIDGRPLDPGNAEAWKASTGYVPQDIFLVDGSVAQNIALGTPPDKIDMARVREASRIAQIEQFVERDLLQGFETEVGEQGVRLSGGQRQRIGIARALYREADLILFDEATSALDTVTEREVISAVENLSDTKTVLMIAHRLSTVKLCDRILVLNRGRIAGFDTPDRLEAENSHYQKLLQLPARPVDEDSIDHPPGATT